MTPMPSYLFINKVSPEFAELLATRPITILEFLSTRMDCIFNAFKDTMQQTKVSK